MSGEILIQAENVSKRFCRNLRKSLLYGVQDVATDLMGRSRADKGLRREEFWANKDVSLKVRRGECVGLIGQNGAGKTTLLKMLNGLFPPDRGSITMRGRVGALLALGAGFNPILTGRENVYINGSVLGLSKREIEARLDEIVDFSGIGDFMDTPVQSYSSGMQVRLGFAVATAMNPDVLLLDEVLAVGDAAFRHKCYNRINKLIDDCAVVFVSHTMEHVAAVSTCVGMMSKGELQFYDEVTEGIQAYHQANEAKQPTEGDKPEVFVVYAPVTKADLRVCNPEVNYGEKLEIEIDIETTEFLDDLRLTFTAQNPGGQPVMNWNSLRAGERFSIPAGHSRISLQIQPLWLHDGVYHWCLGMNRRGAIEQLVYAMRAGTFRVRSAFPPVNNIPYLPGEAKFSVTAY